MQKMQIETCDRDLANVFFFCTLSYRMSYLYRTVLSYLTPPTLTHLRTAAIPSVTATSLAAAPKPLP